MNIDQRLSVHKQNCQNGKHIWKEWLANTQVDDITFEPTGMSYFVGYLNGEPKYRGCIICGKKERQSIEWESV